MIGILTVKKDNETIFSCEFPLEDEGIVGMKWADGVKFCIDEFRKAYPGLRLADTHIIIGARQ